MNVHQSFMLPPPVATAELVMKDGARIRLRRYGRPGGTRLVFSHGNGLAINAYAPFWLPLAQDYDVVVFDIRNHGENPLHHAQAHSWESFYSDFEYIFEGLRLHFGAARTVGVFHSLASVASLEHSIRKGKRWDALFLFDPPVMPSDGHPLQPLEQADMEYRAARALRRTDIYDAPHQLAAQFRRGDAFKRWLPEEADLVARHTLRETSDGRWMLCCPPQFEAHVFSTNTDATLFPRICEIDIPLMIVGGDPQSPHASPAASVAKAIHDEFKIEYAMVPDTTHFLQFEEPQTCRDLLIAFLARHGLDSRSVHKASDTQPGSTV